MSPAFPYRLLWEERQLLSVANLTRQDGLDFLRVAPEMGIVTSVTRYKLTQANQALADLRAGLLRRRGGPASLTADGRPRRRRYISLQRPATWQVSR